MHIKVHSIVTCSFIFLFFISSVNALVKGFSNLVSIESDSFTFPAADTNNTITGFVWIRDGFSLEDASTTCTYDALYPVSGDIHFNGGSFYLQDDLKLRGNVSIDGLGSIYANSHLLEICCSITWVQGASDGSTIFDNIRIPFESDITLSNTITFQGYGGLCGDNHQLILDPSAYIIVAPNSTLFLRNVKIRGIKGNNIQCSDDSAKILLEGVTWIQDDDFTFGKGSILFKNEVSFLGTYTFAYESNQTSTIDYKSVWKINGETTVKAGRSSNIEPFYFNDHTSVWYFRDSTLHVTTSGLTVDQGTFQFDHDVFIDLHSTDTNTGIVFGDGLTSEGQFVFYSASNLRISSGHFTYNSLVPDAFKSHSKESRLIREPGNYFYVSKSFTAIDMAIESDASNVLELADGANFVCKGSTVRDLGSDFELTGTFLDSSSIVLDKDDFIILNFGLFHFIC